MGEPIKESYIKEVYKFVEDEPNTCPVCGGSGEEETKELICRRCKGSGEIENV